MALWSHNENIHFLVLNSVLFAMQAWLIRFRICSCLAEGHLLDQARRLCAHLWLRPSRQEHQHCSWVYLQVIVGSYLRFFFFTNNFHSPPPRGEKWTGKVGGGKVCGKKRRELSGGKNLNGAGYSTWAGLGKFSRRDIFLEREKRMPPFRSYLWPHKLPTSKWEAAK